MPITATSQRTSSSLLQRVKQFEPDAWQRLCDVYGPQVYRWARTAGLGDGDAADVGQEVFRTVVGKVTSFDDGRPDSTFRGWLWTITRNKLREHFRRAANLPNAVGGSNALKQIEQLADAPLDQSDASDLSSSSVKLMQQSLQLIRGEFEDRTWQAFWRSAIDELPTDEIADELGMTRKAVRQAKYRVLRRLRDEVAGLEASS
jgi:RNA polymerase sigma-70 factor (ECF subfamily)